MLELRQIPLELLNEPPFPIRAQMGEQPMEELVESIRVNGIEVPLKVRPVGDRFEVVAGHRRMKVAIILGLREVPCLVESMSDEDAVRKLIAENTGREEVSAAESGWFYLELVERFKYNESQLCRLTGKSPGYINERITLVREDPEIALAVNDKKISFTVARELLRVNHYTAALVWRVDPATIPEEDRQRYLRHRRSLLDLCIRGGATQKVARSYVEQWKATLVPVKEFQPSNGPDGSATSAASRPQRCLCCGRDADPQNFIFVPIHFYEKDGVFKILREAGLPVYE